MEQKATVTLNSLQSNGTSIWTRRGSVNWSIWKRPLLEWTFLSFKCIPRELS